ncbi:30S ribosomal protein S4 [Candidatus Aerophobetes bacterium]|nr:30S ribosomal protein S4 [Candidatus Aerophobetes bacterium]
MGIQIESRCKRCRRLNYKLFLKGEKCFTNKCALEKRKSASKIPPHRVSQYSRQLREKQKLRFIYGVTENQFKRYYERAEKGSDVTGEELLRLLERRLDNVVWRLSWASSRSQARQLVSHGHFVVNGRKVWTPSSLVKEGDIIEAAEKSKKMDLIKQNLQLSNRGVLPEWLEVTTESLKAVVRRLPQKEELEQDIDVTLIVEYYSRR